jgi:hypothetical protein
MSSATRPSPVPGPQLGGYYHSQRELYRVEDVHVGGVLVEDCSTGQLVDLPSSDFARLTPVRRECGRSAA